MEQTLEKEYERRDSQRKNQDTENQPKKKKNKFLKFLSVVFDLCMIGIVLVLFLLYGPYNKFRDWYITTAMTTMTHQYLATWLYSAETISDVLNRNKVEEVDSITDTNKIMNSNNQKKSTNNYANEYEKAVLEKDESHPEYKLIKIKEKEYEGYLAVVYDASKIHTMVSSKLGTYGQFVTTMAQNNKAALAINGGGFDDPNHNGTGGSPLGLTIANSKILTDYSYTGAGGLIGFDKDNKLVIGKMNSAKAKSMNIRDGVTCGPFLIINGESSKVLGNGGWGTAPRTAIGQRTDGIVLMLVVDGRKAGMPGADMDDLIKIMKRYGAYNAAALDGGTSSVMVENYKVINDPVNGSGAHKTRPIATAFGVII